MKPVDPSGNAAEVLRLGLVEGVSVRQIARQLHLARKTVRKILGRHQPPAKAATAPRGSLLDPYEKAIHTLLDDTPEMLAPAVLERLRPLGYTGGVTILRARLRSLRQHGQREAFLTLHFEPGAAVQIDWADFGFALPGVSVIAKFEGDRITKIEGCRASWARASRPVAPAS
jgi:Homeodomain-like domain